ncbi:MAG: S-layer homology domain-containing protein [Clostridia bacterium]|nr:S-layer homology domain-containing protein [Clostridia bacterium]
MKSRRILSALIAAALVIGVLTAALPLYSGASTKTLEKTGYSRNVDPRFYCILINPGTDESLYHVTWQSDNMSRMELQWTTADKVVDGVFPEDHFTAESTMTVETHRADMTDLEPDTEYAYRIGSDSIGWSGPYTLKTSNYDDGRFSFIAVGDPQLGTGGSAEAHSQNWDTSLQKARSWFGDNIDFVFSLGDQVNSYDVPLEYDEFARTEVLRSLPLITVPGNHDEEGDSYSAHYTYSNVDQKTCGEAGIYGGDFWIAHDGCLFISLNSIDISLSLHRDFIERAINEYTELYGEPNWKIVGLHYSPYSGAEGRWNSNYRVEYSPIFSEFDIDVVLGGHDHVYCRAYMSDVLTPIDDPERYVEVGGDPFGSFYDPEDGQVFYMTANSSSGSKFYEAAKTDLPYLCKKNQENVPNITKVDVTDDMITFTTYRSGADNNITDIVDFFALHHTKDLTEDKNAPVLTVPAVERYDPAEPVDLTYGISAYDDFDGELTDKIEYTGAPDPYGESIITYSVTDKAGNTAVAERKLIPLDGNLCVATEDTVWRYLDTGEAPFDIYDDEPLQLDWTRPGFDDSAWAEAKGGFGFCNDMIMEFDGVKPNTKLTQYSPESTKEDIFNIPAYFFRTTFDLDDPENVDIIDASFWYDDGFDMYINGVRIKTINRPFGLGLWNYAGSECSDFVQKCRFSITDKETIRSLDLKPTGNVVAVEIFQSTSQSEDIYFDMDRLFIGKTANIDSLKLPFKDVPDGAWFTTNIKKAYKAGYFSGMSDDTFAPNGSMTRAMIWTVLARIAGQTPSEGEKWYSWAQDWAVANGVSDGTYPDQSITREQFVTMLYALTGRPGVTGDIDKYADKGEASDWAVAPIIWAVSKGIITGRSETEIAPKATATRAEACTIIIKYTSVEK